MAPSPTSALTVERRAEFAVRFRACIASFPFTPKGEALLAAYPREHAEAERRYADLLALARHDGDHTDAILAALLPHADTPANRARDVWLSHAPTTASDPKAWLTRKGWVRGEEWPRVAEALLRFVRRSTDDPTQLDAACHDFAALPDIRGFQMGMLSPILHALRPAEFCLVTSAARAVIAHFTGARCAPKLTDLPAANAAAWTIIHDAADLFADPRAPALPPSDLFDFVCQWLVANKGWQGTEPRFWRVAAPDDARWEVWRREGYLAIDAPYASDITDLTPAEFAERRTALPALNADAFARLWTFAHDLRERDEVLVNVGRTLLGAGTVTGPYYHVAGTRDAHRIPMQWERVGSQPLTGAGARSPLAKLTQGAAEAFIAALPASAAPRVTPAARPPQPETSDGAMVRETPAPYGVNGHGQRPYTLAECAAETLLDLADVERYAQAIRRKGQAILAGPPGTGKTYLAERLARALRSDGGMWEMIQFHPAYSYEDFIQGIRPQSGEDGQLRYPLVAGRFLDFCARARGQRGICALVVDEINRANLASVFGEVLALLDYRDHAIPLAGGGTFAIPANVVLIGTMNTADRSIALVDYALRRRFAFIEIGPNYETLRRFHARTGFGVAPLVSTLQRINAAISDPHYALGISYFLRDDLAATLPDIWTMEVEPYLAELFFDRSAEMEVWRWSVVAARLLPTPRASR